jgi:hypothetical protein
MAMETTMNILSLSIVTSTILSSPKRPLQFAHGRASSRGRLGEADSLAAASRYSVVINYYGVTIYKILGFSTRDSRLIIGLSGSLSLVECSIALYFLEKLGRIKPMIFSAASMACALVINAVLSQYFINADGAANPNANALRAMVRSLSTSVED